MKAYRHLYFDLDHTLWDFEANSREAILELHAAYGLASQGVAAEAFVEKYFEINTAQWALFHRGVIDRATLRTIRFEKTFGHFGLRDTAAAREFPDAYLSLLPDKKNLVPGGLDVLNALRRTHALHLITNGFFEVQQRKLESSGLLPYFGEVIISEAAGARKPEKAIFDHALRCAGATAAESVMIGDDFEADIEGALGAGWDAVFFNPQKRPHHGAPTHEVTSLRELLRLF